MNALDRIRESRLHRDESGTTMLEMVVAMALLVVFMAMFTGAMLLMSRTAIKVEGITTTAAQADGAFQRLDREIRYANAVSTAKFDTTAGLWHVEWDTTRVTRPSTDNNKVISDDICDQLRLNPVTDKLELRTWRVTSGSPGYDSLTAWSVLASNVVNGATTDDRPFGTPDEMSRAANAATTAATSQSDTSVQLQQLAFKFVTGSSNVTDSTKTTSTYTFTALNSADALGSGSPVCQQVAIGASS